MRVGQFSTGAGETAGRGAIAAWAVLALGACAFRGDATTSRGPGDLPPSSSPMHASAAPGATPDAARTAGPVARVLTLDEARRYMVELVNSDRASMGLSSVVLDEGAPTRAGQAHAEDMASHGYLGHWGTDGSVPEQRFTEAGGADMVLENASCFTDEHPRKLDRAARVEAINVQRAEDMFFHERPPNDGHRKNILKTWHKKVGIGVAQPVAMPGEIPTPCFAQEFTDPYGEYTPTPRRTRLGETLRVEGAITAPATFAGVGLARVEAPKPLSVSEVNRRRSYPVPAPYQMYWPPGYQTPIPVKVTGNRFAIDVPVSDGGKSGMYELSVWASFPGSPDPVMVSLRTFVAH
jgi:uncharacterized protein YkwD